MSARNDGGPAFPREDYQADSAPGQRGMSLRDYFAAKAMQGMWSNAELLRLLPQGTEAITLANMAYEQADSMLKAREA